MHSPPFQWMARLEGRVRWVGIGNAEQQDDAVGLVLAQRLQEAGESEVVVAGLHPERAVMTPDLVGVDHVVFLDAVDVGAAPACVVFLSADAMNTQLPAVSTHRFPLALLARWVETHAPTRAWLLGVQPAALGAGSGLSPDVQRSVDLLATLLPRGSRRAPAPSIEPRSRPAEEVLAVS